MLLTPLSYSATSDPFVQSSLGSATNYQQFNTSPYEGTPIFLLPSPTKTSSPFRFANQASKTTSATAQKDTGGHFHIFVGDLSSELDTTTLRNAFASFGEISDVKIIKDTQSLKSKGYGFVSFVQREDAEKAIEQMNGRMLGKKQIRTNWASRKQAPSAITLEEIMSMTSLQNTTVYIGGISANVTENDLTKVFEKYGNPVEIRMFKEQGYGFVRFETKESAANAIFNLNGSEIFGSTVKCSWGKEKPTSKDCLPFVGDNFFLQYAAAVNYLDTLQYYNSLNNNQMANYQQPHQVIHQHFPPTAF